MACPCSLEKKILLPPPRRPDSPDRRLPAPPELPVNNNNTIHRKHTFSWGAYSTKHREGTVHVVTSSTCILKFSVVAGF
mgnify:CR=1 FL=1